MRKSRTTPPIQDLRAANGDRAGNRETSVPVLDGLEFPGCEAVPMSRVQFLANERRLEFWDERAGVAMIADAPSPTHERPLGLLSGAVERIAQERGSRIERYATMDLVWTDADGYRRAMQADECLYVHPERANLPTHPCLVVGRDDPPDVVVEIDHTTDVRRGKLKVYESWAFPELWIEVPDSEPPSGRRSRLAGLTIYLRSDNGYQVSAESRAFPGWRDKDIHVVANEAVITPRMNATLRRVGAAMGARDGTGPDDDPLLAAHRRESRAEGRLEGRIQERADLVRETLRARGVALSADFPTATCRSALAQASLAAIAAASLACADEAEFERRVRA